MLLPFSEIFKQKSLVPFRDGNRVGLGQGTPISFLSQLYNLFLIPIPNSERGRVDISYSHLPKKMIVPSPSQLCFRGWVGQVWVGLGRKSWKLKISKSLDQRNYRISLQYRFKDTTFRNASIERLNNHHILFFPFSFKLFASVLLPIPIQDLVKK